MAIFSRAREANRWRRLMRDVFSRRKFRECRTRGYKREGKKRDKSERTGQVRARGPRVRGSFENTDATDEVLSRTRFCRVLRVARGRAIERTFAPANQRHRRARRDQSTAAPTASFQRRGSAPRRLKLRSAWNPLTAFLIFRLKKDKVRVHCFFFLRVYYRLPYFPKANWQTCNGNFNFELICYKALL